MKRLAALNTGAHTMSYKRTHMHTSIHPYSTIIEIGVAWHPIPNLEELNTIITKKILYFIV